MVLTYNGIDKLLTKLDISKDELSEAVLNPYSHPETWSRGRAFGGGHDYHELQLLHDTLCFIYDRKGKISTRSIDVLRDHFQDTENFTAHSLIPALIELGLVEIILDDDVLMLTNEGYKLKRCPRFLD